MVIKLICLSLSLIFYSDLFNFAWKDIKDPLYTTFARVGIEESFFIYNSGNSICVWLVSLLSDALLFVVRGPDNRILGFTTSIGFKNCLSKLVSLPEPTLLHTARMVIPQQFYLSSSTHHWPEFWLGFEQVGLGISVSSHCNLIQYFCSSGFIALFSFCFSDPVLVKSKVFRVW